MNLTTYRKEFSIFIYNENLHLARHLKETLIARGYEAHFYDSETLLKQAIYLTLPHIVILPYHAGVDEKISEISEISREIQVILVGEAADDEAMAWLAEQGAVYDFVSDPVRFAQTFAHRVDKAVEKWLISFAQEQPDMVVMEAPPSSAAISAAGTFSSGSSALGFVDNVAQASGPDSLIYDLLTQSSEAEAVAWVLQKTSSLVGKDFVYLKYNAAAEVLGLRDISFGMTQKHDGLGIKITSVNDHDHFFKSPGSYKVWSDFFREVFSAEETPFFVVRGAGAVLGVLVALGPVGEDSRSLIERFAKTLSLVLENRYQAALIFEHMTVETRTFCLRSKAFYEELANEISRARRVNLPVSVISFEIRASNSAHLHAAQQLVGKILKRFTRVTDFIGRISERRFAAALPHAELENAAKKAATLLSIIQAAIEERTGLAVTVSAGVNEFPLNVTDSMSLLEGSEEAAEQAGAFEVLVYQKEENIRTGGFQL